MAHPFCHTVVGKRRVKAFKRASGGEVTSRPSAMRNSGPIADDEAEEAKVAVGKKASSRLDRRARGAIAKQFGGSIGARKLTPSKHKPHVRININNINARPRRVPVPVPVPVGGMGGGMAPGIGALPGMKKGGRVRRKQVGGGLPTQANPRAVAALAARPALPAQAQGMRPFQVGGAARPAGLPAQANPRAAAALAARPALPRASSRRSTVPRWRTVGRQRKLRLGSSGLAARPALPTGAMGVPPFKGRADVAATGQCRAAEALAARLGFKHNQWRVVRVGAARPFQRGGHIMPAKMNEDMDDGQGSGEGRLEQAHSVRRHRAKTSSCLVPSAAAQSAGNRGNRARPGR